MRSLRPSYGRAGNYEYQGPVEYGRFGPLIGGQKHVIPTVRARVKQDCVYINRGVYLSHFLMVRVRARVRVYG